VVHALVIDARDSQKKPNMVQSKLLTPV